MPRLIASRQWIGIILIVCPTVSATAQHVRFVDDDAPLGGDGRAWATAYRHLQDALAEAGGDPTISDIRIAEGVYKPDLGETGKIMRGDREATFQLRSELVIAGGYRGVAGGGDPDDRNIDVFVTILSGDLSGDDQPGFVNYGENSLHIVTGSGTDDTAVLDGVVVEAGNASASEFPGSVGAGIYIDAGNPTIRLCIIRSCITRDGGSGAGMANYASSPVLIRCRFTGNFAGQGRQAGGIGGAMVISSASHPVIEECIFANNEAASAGAIRIVEKSAPMISDSLFLENVARQGAGAIIILNSDPVILRCRFEGNWARTSGAGAIGENRASCATVVDCDFVANFADANGGAYQARSDNLIMERCRFIDNVASLLAGAGGGLHLDECSPRISNCEFIGNLVANGNPKRGGGVYVEMGSPILTDCLFIENEAGLGGGLSGFGDGSTIINCLFANNVAREGGGIFGSVSAMRILNCTLFGNEATGQGQDQGGGGVFVKFFSNMEVSGGILWGNSAMRGDQLALYHTAVLDVGYSDVQGGREEVHVARESELMWGDGNIDADPLFVDPDNGDYRLGFRSPCVDAGDNQSVPPEVVTDLNGNPRFVDDPVTPDTGNGMAPIVDMGPLEFQTMLVPADIKPGSCPNPLNRTSRGKVPIAVVGTSEFDVSMIDIDSLLLTRADGVGGAVAPLSGPPGPRIRIEDVATPFDGEPCDCHELEGDGIDDLSMKFDTQALVAELELSDLPGGAFIELVISGQLLDGTNFSGIDCIRLVPPNGGGQGLTRSDGEAPEPDTQPKPSFSVGVPKENGEDPADESMTPNADPAPIGCGGVMPSFLLAALAGMWLMTRRVRPI